MEQKVYVETTIVSYYTVRPNKDLVIAARQEITHEVWPILQEKFILFISALAIQEASRGNTEAARKRLSAISGIPVLEISREARELAESLINTGAIPAESEEDALHIGVASINGMDFLLTWNFSHINNAFKKSQIIRTIEERGFVPPEICSPEEFLGE